MCIRKNKYKENIKMHFLFLLWVGIISCEASYEIIKKSLYEKRGRNTKLDGPDGSEFIYHGNIDNPPGSWPWVVSLGAQDTRDGHHIHICTGVIVSDNNIMTTVGCLDYLLEQTLQVERGEEGKDKDQIYAKAGDNKLKVTLDDQGIQLTQLQDYVIHPGYGIPDETNYHYHDIAILTMKTPFVFNKYVRPIELPAINEAGEIVLEENLVDGLLIFSDWGKESNGKSMSSRSMLIKPAKDCQISYSYFSFPKELLCGVENPSLSKICNVDYGTPIVNYDQELNRYVLKGFFSMDVFSEEWMSLRVNPDNDSCKIKNNPNLVVPITSKSNIRFIYNQLYEMSFPIKLEPPNQKIAPTTFPEDANLIYENCGRNILLEREPNDPKSQLKKYPWQVSFGYVNPENSDEWLHFCGGSIVTRTKVVTAAHCVKEFQGMLNRSIVVSARAGDDKLQNTVDDEGLQIVGSKSFSIHPQYKQGTRYFDVGVVELKDPLEMTKFVRPICLLNLSEAKKITKEEETGLPLTTTGWGKNDFNEFGEDLKETLAIVLTEGKCNQTHEKSSVNKGSVPKLFSSDLLCASDPTGNAGTCKGDSGGPAVHLDQRKKRYYLRAIVSGSALGICGSESFPNIYVRTADPSLLTWILEQVKQKPQNVFIEGKTVISPKQPIRYNCSADSYPVSDFSWIVRDKDGNEIPSKSSENSLEISSEEESDNILVTCVANNFMGRGKTSKRGLDDVPPLPKGDPAALIMGSVVVLVMIVLIIGIVSFIIYQKRTGRYSQITSCCVDPCGKKKSSPMDTVDVEGSFVPLLQEIKWKSETQKLAKVSHGRAGTWGINDEGEIFQRISNGKWKKVEGPKLMDISVGSKEIWGVDMSNKIYKFELINEHARTPWEPEGEDFIQVSVSPLNTNNPDVWACDKDYKILHRQSKGEWMPIKTAPKVKMVTVGEAGVWIISDDDDVYFREGTYGKIENNMGAPTQMVPSGWNKVPEDKKFLWLSCGEDIVWAINTKDELLYREGISENSNQKIGTKWVLGPVKGVNGNLKQIDVCGKSLWGVNSENRVYYSE